MPELQRLRADHAPALLAFERENRAWFARTISDRGDAYFAEFPARHQALLTYQDEGTDHFHVLVADDGTTILGRFNLMDIEDGEAELGFRMAESATGQGLATQAAHAVCHLAATDYALTSLRAQANLDNPHRADPRRLHGDGGDGAAERDGGAAVREGAGGRGGRGDRALRGRAPTPSPAPPAAPRPPSPGPPPRSPAAGRCGWSSRGCP